MEEKGNENLGSAVDSLTLELAELEAGRQGEWRRLRDMFDEPFDAMDAFLREIERKIQDDHYALSLCGRPLLRGIHNRIKEVVAEIEKKIGKIKVCLDENHPMYSPGYEPVTRIEIESSPTEDIRGGAAGGTRSGSLPGRHQGQAGGNEQEALRDFGPATADILDEEELRRVIEVMKHGGGPWQLLRKSIACAWEGMASSTNKEHDMPMEEAAAVLDSIENG